MIGLLVKREKGYHLERVPFIAFVSTERTEHNYKKLSLSNCQTIENGYDLDELFESVPSSLTDTEKQRPILRAGFIVGFQKALEILGDNKFNYGHLDKMFTCGKLYQDSKNEAYCFSNVLSKFEQTEWRVEVKTEKIPCDHNDGWEEVPVLDKNGCLILTKV